MGTDTGNRSATYAAGKFTPFFFDLKFNLYTIFNKLSVSPQTPLNVDNYNNFIRILIFCKSKGRQTGFYQEKSDNRERDRMVFPSSS
jgi:hypothetical protein